MTTAPDRTGILILHVWMEQGMRRGLRARITQSVDSGSSERTIATASTNVGIYALVETWLEAFIADN